MNIKEFAQDLIENTKLSAELNGVTLTKNLPAQLLSTLLILEK